MPGRPVVRQGLPANRAVPFHATLVLAKPPLTFNTPGGSEPQSQPGNQPQQIYVKDAQLGRFVLVSQANPLIQNVSTPYGNVQLAFRPVFNAGKTSLSPTLVSAPQYVSTQSQTANGFTSNTTTTYNFALQGNNLVLNPMDSTGQITYGGTVVGSVANGTITPSTSATVSQPLYGNVPGAEKTNAQGTFLGTETLRPQVQNGQLTLGYAGFTPTSFQVQLGGGLGVAATTSFNPDTNQVNVNGAVFPGQSAPNFSVPQQVQAYAQTIGLGTPQVGSAAYQVAFAQGLRSGGLGVSTTTSTLAVAGNAPVQSIGAPIPIFQTTAQQVSNPSPVIYSLLTGNPAYATATIGPQVQPATSITIAQAQPLITLPTSFTLTAASGDFTSAIRPPTGQAAEPTSLLTAGNTNQVQYGLSGQAYLPILSADNKISTATTDFTIFINRQFASYEQAVSNPATSFISGAATKATANTNNNPIAAPLVSAIGQFATYGVATILSTPLALGFITNPTTAAPAAEQSIISVGKTTLTNPAAGVGQIAGLLAGGYIIGGVVEEATGGFPTAKQAISDIATGKATPADIETAFKTGQSTAQFYQIQPQGEGEIIASKTPTGYDILTANPHINVLPPTQPTGYLLEATGTPPAFTTGLSTVSGKVLDVSINENLPLNQQEAAYQAAAQESSKFLYYQEPAVAGTPALPGPGSVYSITGVRFGTKTSLINSQFLTVYEPIGNLQGFITGHTLQEAAITIGEDQRGFMIEGNGAYNAYVSKLPFIRKLLGQNPVLTQVASGSLSPSSASSEIGAFGRTNLFTRSITAGDKAVNFNLDRMTGTSLILEKPTQELGGLKQKGFAIYSSGVREPITTIEVAQKSSGGTSISGGRGGGQVQTQVQTGQLLKPTPVDTETIVQKTSAISAPPTPGAQTLITATRTATAPKPSGKQTATMSPTITVPQARSQTRQTPPSSINSAPKASQLYKTITIPKSDSYLKTPTIQINSIGQALKPQQGPGNIFKNVQPQLQKQAQPQLQKQAQSQIQTRVQQPASTAPSALPTLPISTKGFILTPGLPRPQRKAKNTASGIKPTNFKYIPDVASVELNIRAPKGKGPNFKKLGVFRPII